VEEAKAASALNHPNIVHIYDVAQADGVQFISMEYVRGKTLDQLIGRKGLRLDDALKPRVDSSDLTRLAVGFISMRRHVPALCAVLCVAVMFPLRAQGPDALSQFFEGKQVSVKMDMPATQQGADLYPQRTQALDLNTYSRRIKQFGAALRTGDSVMITKVRVKEKVIEFQLGGGGYGTFGDDTDESVSAPQRDKSRREKNLEGQIKTETDSEARKRLRRQLDDLRNERERQNDRDRVLAAEASETKKQRIGMKRLQGGSRLNILYEPRVPADVLTPQAVVAVLSPYVAFAPETFGDSALITREGGSGVQGQAPGPDSGDAADPTGSLRKGMTREAVESLLGKPSEVADKEQGGLKVTSCTFQRKDATVRAEFVSDVLIRYTVSSK
jgi:hypothetical protein